MDREIEWAIRTDEYEWHDGGSQYEVDMMDRMENERFVSPTPSHSSSQASDSSKSNYTENDFETIDINGDIVVV